MSEIHEQAVHFEARKVALSQRPDGSLRLTFELAPEGLPPAMLMCKIGTRLMVAAVGITDQEQPAALPEPAELAQGSDRTARRIVQRAGILCSDRGFALWLSVRQGRPQPEGVRLADHAADMVRGICGVASRADIGGDAAARRRFLDLEDEWTQSSAMGREFAPDPTP